MIIAIIPRPRRRQCRGLLKSHGLGLVAGMLAAAAAGPDWACSQNFEDQLETAPALQMPTEALPAIPPAAPPPLPVPVYSNQTDLLSAIAPLIGMESVPTNKVAAKAKEDKPEGEGEGEDEDEGEESIDVVKASPSREKLYEALYNIQDKLYAEAIPKLEWVIAEDPALLGAWQALGWAYWETGRKNDALKLWERLQILAPNEPLSYNCLAMTAAATNDIARATALYRQSLALNPDQYDIRHAFYRTLVWQGDFDRAIPGLRDLLKQDPERLDVRLELAKTLMTYLNYDEALTHWNIICEQIPDNVEYAVARAQNLLALGDLELSAEETRRVLAMDPGNVKALSLMTDIAEFSNKPDDAVKELRKLADNTQDKLLKTQILYRLAVLLRDLHESNPDDYPLTKIIAVANEGVDCDPRAVYMRLFLGELLSADQQYVAARNVFETVLKDFNSNNLRAKNGIIEICLALGQLAEAEDRLNDMQARFDPYDPYRYYYLARLEYARGNYFDALLMLDRLEEEGARGAVMVLLYEGLAESEWSPLTSVRQLREHLQALKSAGFKFIAPDQVPAYFEARPPPPLDDTQPFLNRWWHWISYSFTGTDKPQPSPLREYKPEKVACVTFDNAWRSTFIYGTPIAEELGTRFGLYIPVSRIQQHSPLTASWEEMRRYEASGCWAYGSHLFDALTPAPIDSEGYLAYSLSNQIWDPVRNRMETLRAYLARIRREFKGSRETIVREIGLKTNDCRIVAYPSGIGQESLCNVQDVDNVCETILNEAHMNYDMGWIQSIYGYTVKGDNPLLYQRFKPKHRDGGEQVVKHAFEMHPVFLARRLRAEIAALQGKPNLAMQMLEELNRDGYPEDSLKTLSTYVKDHLSGKIQAPQVGPTESKRAARWLSLAHPFVGADFRTTRDNIVIDEWHLGARAGVNLNPRLSVEALGGIGDIKQTITAITPYTLQMTTATTNRVTTITTENGINTSSEKTTINYEQVTIQTNTIYTEDFKSTEQAIGLRLNYRAPGGFLLFGELRQRSFSASPQTNWMATITNINGTMVTNIGPATFTDDAEIVGALELQGKPLLAMDAKVRYEHDVMSSAHKIITYDSGELRGSWRIQDWWNIEAYGVYTFLSDANTTLRAGGSTDWLLSERQGLYVGMQYHFITAEDASIEYWTPYWQQRYYLTARLQRSSPNYYASVQARLGWTKELLRPEEQAANPTQGQPGWQPVIGVDASLRRNLFRHLDIYGQASVNFLQNFTERNIVVGLVYDFEGKK